MHSLIIFKGHTHPAGRKLVFIFPSSAVNGGKLLKLLCHHNSVLILIQSKTAALVNFHILSFALVN